MAMERDPWRQVRIGMVALMLVLVGGTIGYRVVGLGLFDAFYQTLITISTVGFTEVGDSDNSSYRVITSVVIIFGVGVALYTLGFAFEAIMDGRLREHVGRSRLQHAVDQLSGHIVLCGWGQVGKSIYAALRAEGKEVVVVDRLDNLAELVGGLAVAGEATDDAVLRRAGVERASGLVVALNSDADNMYVTLSGRSLNRDLFIVSRCNTAAATPKLLQAGADRVVNPHRIGGSRMAAFVLQPNVADFLGEAMPDGRLDVQLREFVVEPGSVLEGATIERAGVVRATGVSVLAIKRRDGSFVHTPPPTTTLGLGDVAIVLGTPEQHTTIRARLDR